jgi:aflatoxin B1 aldehyde reductase
MVEKYISICDSKGYVKPSVLQVGYNLIDRSIESSLLSLIHKHNMHIVAYSPLAGSFLTGKLTAEVAGGPAADHTILRQAARAKLDQPHLHEAVRSLQKLIEPHNIGTAEAALRWLAYHSALGERDAILFGMSRVEHLEQNVADIRKGPLPDDVVKGCDELWATLGKVGQ